ncbi:hypothetical protein FO014_09190 [Serratia rhizosphaerae]|uniref:Uncharacterized protein n=1 Tax=Serratia rhizosphaerae TaxID=2597702 RepID=A0ABX6GLE0_9GAMM|nr:hypothetical protein FO014_09190 [Serratia rhizosphaerae]
MTTYCWKRDQFNTLPIDRKGSNATHLLSPHPKRRIRGVNCPKHITRPVDSVVLFWPPSFLH